jgi:hypothetical protein
MQILIIRTIKASLKVNGNILDPFNLIILKRKLKTVMVNYSGTMYL